MRLSRSGNPFNRGSPLSLRWLLLAAALALATRGLGAWVAPLQCWLIACHELFHALAALATGGSVASIEARTTHGLTMTVGGIYPIISAAGYLGCAGVGAVLLRYCAREWAGGALCALCASLALSLLLKSAITLDWALAQAVNAIIWLAWLRLNRQFVLALVGTLFLSLCFDDMGSLLISMTSQTDAGLLARHWGAPFLAWPIALCYAGLAALFWAMSLRGLLRELRGAP